MRALESAQLGDEVREMNGGFEYWAREGYPVEDAEGIHRRAIDPLVGIPRIRSRTMKTSTPLPPSSRA